MNKNPGAPVNRVSLYDVTIDRKSIISYNKLYPNQKLKKFIETVRSIAVPGFNELMLKEYIDVLNFRKLIITYARYKNEIIGFSAVVIQEKKTTRGKSFFVCKGFPAISIEYRTATQKDPEVESLFFKLFQKMTKHLIQFYIKNEEPIKKLLSNGIDILKKNWNKYPPEVQKFVSILLNLTPFLLQKINFSDPQVIDLMKQIESYFNKREYYLLSYAENPVMYVAMKDFDFIGPKPDASDLKKVSSFRTVHELIGASYRQMQSKKQNEYLRRVKREPYERGNNNMPNEDHEILVNITASEWRAAFEYAMSGTTDKHLLARYFLWQNYRFPNYAFELRTPLTPRNMGGNNYYFQVLMEVLKNSQ